MKLILGSASPSRQKILKDMGFAFDVVKPDINEKSIRNNDPKTLTLMLARAKAEAVKAKLNQPAVIITSDQVVEFSGRILEKPENEQEARFYLENAHLPANTVTAVVVTNTRTGQQVEGVDVMTVEMRPFPAKLINDYIKQGTCYTHAGGFDIDDPMIKPYVKEIRGERESGMGLPKALTLRLLKDAGYEQS